MADVFTRIISKASSMEFNRNSTEARDWLRTKARQVSKVNEATLLQQRKGQLMSTMTRFGIGRMFMFMYDPKYKETLPFYDRFPLVMPFGIHNDGFIGINFHYLPLPLRARLMDNLYTVINNDAYNDTTKIKLSYNLLVSSAKFRYVKPCIKQYLFNHVKSRFLYIPPEEWDVALFLPTERFSKAKKDQVFKNSRASI